jgi:hypothetical protein
MAERSSARSISVLVVFAFAESASAAIPATIGVADEVPQK